MKIVYCLVLLIGLSTEENENPHNSPVSYNLLLPQNTHNADKSDKHNECIYTEWSVWSGTCPPPHACAGGIQVRNRQPAGNTGKCTDTMEQKTCDQDCVHLMVTPKLLVNGMIGNPASAEGEKTASQNNIMKESRFTFGPLSNCSPGCKDIYGLQRDHEIVCIMCANSYSCERAKALKFNQTCKLDVIRSIRNGLRATKLNGPTCSCTFTPEDDLKAGICPSPSPDMNFTVL